MSKSKFEKLIKKGLIILDGSTGTELSNRGMPKGVSPEKWILDNEEAIIDLQSLYAKAGSMIVYAPTFGGNRIKLEEFSLGEDLYDINKKLVELSRKAVGKDVMVFGDLAPTGRFVEPFGDFLFEDAVDVYKEQIKALIDGGVDGFAIETMMDIQEARAALIAVKESIDLPVIVSMTYDESMTTLNGSDPVSTLLTLQALGADAVGCNCSTGPGDMLEIIKLIKPYAKVPIFAKPNAGVPRLKDGVTVFDMEAVEFSRFVEGFIDAGVNLFGGCCGTGPDYIQLVAEEAKKFNVKSPVVESISGISSSRSSIFMGADLPLRIVGERINPTGKKKFQGELRDGKLTTVKRFAIEQKNNGATILDVNMGLSGIDEKEMMIKSISLLSRISPLPLAVDSTKLDVVEAALRIYPGRALLNSISAEKERIEKFLPVAAKYGAMFILLPITDDGIPETLDGRKEAIKYVIEKASKFGYTRSDIVVDALVMTISSDQEAAKMTLDTIEYSTRELGVNTICGLSNVSFGLPERKWINSAFFAMAAGRGLSMAIANPSSEILMNLLSSSDALMGRDKKMIRYVEKFSGADKVVVQEDDQSDPLKMVYNAILQGDEEIISDWIDKALKDGNKPGLIIDDYLIPAITEVGEKFDKKEYFLPQMIMSADAMKKGFDVLEPLLKEDGVDSSKGPVIVIATVKGDIHDIGKNIVVLMLKNYSFNVIDLGKDVAAKDIVASAKENNADVIGLSALMTTTMVEMSDVIAEAKNMGLKDIKFMIGGAVVDQAYADEIGADGYAKDAMVAVKLVQKFTGK